MSVSVECIFFHRVGLVFFDVRFSRFSLPLSSSS